jgi:gliding motility-associated-like protein
MQKKYAFLYTNTLYSVNNIFQCLKENLAINKLVNKFLLLFFLMLSSLGYSQLTTEYFESGIPTSWAVRSNLTVANNWAQSPTSGYLGSGAASVNPALNTTTGTTAEYYLISSQFLTPDSGEIRFYTKQGSFTNKGATYQLRISTANQPDISSFNVVLQSWTETQLNVSATTYEEKIVSIGSIPAGIPVYIAFVAITNQTGTTNTSGDSWFVDNVRAIPGCSPVTGITTVNGSDSAVINWTHPFATQFGIEVVPTGAGHGTVGTIVNSPTYTATGLTSSTSYDVYIQTRCDATTLSTWAGPFPFRTSVLGLSCNTPLIIPPNVFTTPYVLNTNLNTFTDNSTYIPYTTQGSSCLPAATPSTWNYLAGDHAFLSFTPTTSGLVNLTQTVSSTTGGGCYGNMSSAVLIYDSCTSVGTPAGCLGSVVTGSSPPIPTATLYNFYVEAGRTYTIVISSPYQHSASGASICFTFTLSGSTCSAPSGTSIAYSNLLQTSATFSWDNIRNLVSSWQYVAIPTPTNGPTGSETLITTNTNANNNLTGLLPGTSYNFYVRSVCGGVPGPWSQPLPFTTPCLVFSTPYHTDFTGASTTAPEPCWASLDLNQDATKFIYSNDSSPGAPQGQLARLFTSNSGNNTNDMLVTPMVHFDGVTQKRLRFKFKGFGGYTNATGYVLGQSSYAIKLSTTGIGESDFTNIIAPLQTFETGNNWVQRIIPIPINLVGDVSISWHLPQGSLQTATNLTIDDVFIEDMPACSDPMYPAITAGSITSTSAELTWTNGYNTSQWEIIAQPLGTGMPSAAASGTIVNTNPYTFTGLTPSTQYEFYIRSYCDATHQSNWVGPITFYTVCIAQPTPYYESFNDGDITSKKFCWTVQNRNNDSAKWTMNATEFEITPYPVNYFVPLTSFDDWLVSVPLNIIGQKRLRFKYRAATDLFYPTPRAYMEVVISSTPDFANYTVLIPEHEFINNNYLEDSVLFTGTGVSYIAFRVPPTMSNPAGSAHLMIDDVYVEDPPGCEIPSNLTAGAITTNSASLSWSIGYTETQWEIRVQSPMSGVPSGSGIVVNTVPTYNATGLSPDTAYEYYVRAVCDETHSSAWVGPFPFRTICNPLPTPFFETFNSDSTTESCWTVLNNNGDSHFWQTNQSGNSPIGNQMAAMMTGTNGANNDWMISPTLIARPNQRLRFKYKTLSPYFEEDLKVMLSTTGAAPAQLTTVLYQNSFSTTTDASGTLVNTNTITVASTQDVRIGDTFYIAGFPFLYGTRVVAINGLVVTMSANADLTLTGVQNVVFSHEIINNTEFRERVINLPSGLTGNINIGFNVPFFQPNPWNYRGQFVFLDNVIVENIPSCPEVTNIITRNIIDTSAEIYWDVNGSETSWEISMQPFGTPAPIGNTLPQYLTTTTINPTTITGLIPSTRYQYYIRSLCSSTSQSEWVGPFEFLTKCDMSNVCQYTISVSNGSTGRVYQGLELRQNGAMVQMLTFPLGGTNQPTVIDYPVYLCRGVEFSLYFNAGGGSGVQYTQARAIVKDENNNVVWTSPAGLGTPYTNVYTAVSSCGTITCAQPTNLAVSNQGVLSWTPGGTETQWEVSIQPFGNGAIPQSGVIVNSPNYTPVASDFMNPTAGTNDFFVRAICSATSKSFWSGPKTFVRNDEANTAILLPVNTASTCDVSGIDGSFNGATVSINPTTCDAGNLGDIWYDFVATSKVHVVELSDLAPGSYYTSSYQGMWPQIMLGLYEVQPNGSLVQISCSNNNSLVTMYSSELVVGHTYKIRVTLNNTLITGKTFHICITTPNNPCGMDAFNYDFEKLPMQWITGITSIIDARVTPGWRVNTNWGAMFFQEGSNSPGVYPYSGGQCLQLVHDNASTWNPADPNIKGLYKDFDTSEITQMDYSFASATRTNNSTLQLYAGPPAGPFTLVTENTSNSLVWQLVQGNYIVPAGQNNTRFIFRVKNYTIGHLLDAANFKPNTNIITANTILPCTITSVNIAAEGVGQWIADTNNPANTTIVSPNTKITNVTGFSTAGNYIYHWKTRYCDKTITITYQGVTEVPTVVSPLNLCHNSNATALAANVASGYSLLWFTQATGGIGSTIAPIPNTAQVGSTIYYVSAVTATGCVGPRVAITVIINALPTATISGTTSICTGKTTTLTFAGTANAIVVYTINGGPDQTVTLNTSGIATVTSQPLTVDSTFALASVTAAGTLACSKTLTESAVVTVTPLIPQNAVFSYNQTCVNGINPLPIGATGFVTGGVYSSTTLTVNSTTGLVNLSNATLGSHQITYSLPQDSDNCKAATTYDATIILTPGITPVTTFTYNSSYCPDGLNDLPVLTSGFAQGGLFSSTSGLVINSSTGEINIVRSVPGNYTVNYSVVANPSTCALAGTSTFTLSISNPFAVTIDDYCQDQMLLLEALPVNNSFNPLTVTYVWRDQMNNSIGSNSPTLNIDDYLSQHQSLSFPLNFNVSVMSNGCSSLANFTVENDPCKLIPRGFSPNNDDFNDTFNLTGMGVIELVIFNRFGTKVYSFNGNYSNQWNGASNSGQELPDATYFYSIKKATGENITGWVYINR